MRHWNNLALVVLYNLYRAVYPEIIHTSRLKSQTLPGQMNFGSCLLGLSGGRFAFAKERFNVWSVEIVENYCADDYAYDPSKISARY